MDKRQRQIKNELTLFPEVKQREERTQNREKQTQESAKGAQNVVKEGLSLYNKSGGKYSQQLNQLLHCA